MYAVDIKDGPARAAPARLQRIPGQRSAGLAINLAIGPACFVRCDGCYNHFAATEVKGGRISGAEVVGFIDEAILVGLGQTTFSGGDPLSHPDVLMMLEHSKARGLFVNVDTVGSAILRPAHLRFYGKREIAAVDLNRLASAVSQIGLPLDGSTGEIQATFRAGRPDLVSETIELARRLQTLGVKININTVLHKQNRHDLKSIAEVVLDLSPHKWQIFEFQSNGPLSYKNADRFRLDQGEFDGLVEELHKHVSSQSVTTLIEAKSAGVRSGIYIKVDDAGIAYRPSEFHKEREIIGHITRDRPAVISALRRHFGMMAV